MSRGYALNVLSNDRLSLDDYLSFMADLGYELSSPAKNLNLSDFMVMHRKGEIRVIGRSGLKGPPGLPEAHRFRTAIFLYSGPSGEAGQTLEEAVRIAERHRGVVYSLATNQVVTTFLHESIWNPLAPIPSGKIFGTTHEKKALFESWGLSKEQEEAYLPCLGVDGILFAESGHLWSLPEIFGGDKDARTTDLLH